MKLSVARLVSLIFHPVLFSLIIPFLIVYRQTWSGSYALKWQFFSSLFVIIGVVWILIERFRGVFSDYDLSKREERYRFYRMLFFLAASYLLVAVFFKGISFSLSVIACGIILGIIAFEFINSYIKASIHVSVACAWVITVGILYGWLAFVLTFWIIPLVAWARLVLKKHTVSEAIAGGLLGIAITFLTFLVGKLLYNL